MPASPCRRPSRSAGTGASGPRSGTGVLLPLRLYGCRRQHRLDLRDPAPTATRPRRTGVREGPRRRRVVPGRVLTGLRARRSRGYEPRPAGSWAAPGARDRCVPAQGADISTQHRQYGQMERWRIQAGWPSPGRISIVRGSKTQKPPPAICVANEGAGDKPRDPVKRHTASSRELDG